jgi:phenylpropionate dioxygenase-like ring-hydroxylating dioxygenase large terminal subunit
MSWKFRQETFNAEDWKILAGFWHPVAYGHEVGDRPVAARILEQDLVVYRTQAGVTVARDICLHRGVRLSRGRMDAGEIVCPYHGLRYDGTGRCTLIPAQDPEVTITQKLNLQVFPCVERFGLVWTCLEPAAERPPLPDWPQFADPAWQVVPIPAAVWAAAATRQKEKFNNVAHLSHVHVGTFGVASTPRVPGYTVERGRGTLQFEIPYTQVDRTTFEAADTVTITKRYRYECTLPFSSRLWIQSPDGKDQVLVNIAVPITAKTCRVYVTMLRNFDRDQPVAAAVTFEQAVAAEDRPMVEDQRPEELPLHLTDEIHILADRFSVEYRKALAELGLGRDWSG